VPPPPRYQLSDLSRRTGVLGRMLRFCLRMNLPAVLDEPEEYDESHVRRVALVRTLLDVGGLSPRGDPAARRADRRVAAAARAARRGPVRAARARVRVAGPGVGAGQGADHGARRAAGVAGGNVRRGWLGLWDLVCERTDASPAELAAFFAHGLAGCQPR